MVDFVTDRCPHGVISIFKCTQCDPYASVKIGDVELISPAEAERRRQANAPAAHPALLRGVTTQLREASNSLVQIARAVAADRDEAFALLDQVATTLEQTNSDRVLARRIRNFLATHPQ